MAWLYDLLNHIRNLWSLPVLFIPTFAHSFPIEYQFHGTVSYELSFDDCSMPPCDSAVVKGERYEGSLLYDVDTIVKNDRFYYGGIPYFDLVFDKFVVFGNNTKFPLDAIATIDGGGSENDTLIFWDELPQHAGIYKGGDIADFKLYSDTLDAITRSNQFPSSLDNFDNGKVTVALNSWADPFSNFGFTATIEDLTRVGSVPEPPIFILMSIGLLGIITLRRKR